MFDLLMRCYLHRPTQHATTRHLIFSILSSVCGAIRDSIVVHEETDGGHGDNSQHCQHLPVYPDRNRTYFYTSHPRATYWN